MIKFSTFSLCLLTLQLFALPAKVMIIRHAEKPEEGPYLSVKGHERAAALTPYFLGTEDVLEFGPPVAIYAQGIDKPDSSRRPIDTIKPLAQAMNLPIQDSFMHMQFGEMAEKIKTDPAYNGKSVLIAWEHHVIPDLARALGVTDAPSKWHGDVFDRVWIIRYSPDGKTNFNNIPQRLMYGDSSH